MSRIPGRTELSFTEAGKAEGLGKIRNSALSDMFSMRCLLHTPVEMTSRRLDVCNWSPREK